MERQYHENRLFYFSVKMKMFAKIKITRVTYKRSFKNKKYIEMLFTEI